jgi:hypothetical protein
LIGAFGGGGTSKTEINAIKTRQHNNRSGRKRKKKRKKEKEKEDRLTLKEICDVSFNGYVGWLFNESMEIDQNLSKVPIKWKI